MAKTNADNIQRTLKTPLPVYLISGNEPLQLRESQDAIRSMATQHNYTERERYHTDDSSFQWQHILHSSQSMGLFGERKMIEVHMHNNKFSDAGRVISEYCERANEDTLLLINCPKLDRKVQKMAWYQAIDQIGLIVTIWPITEKYLPRWVRQRLNSKGLEATDQAIDLLCTKVEGNLLAAAQEIEKLALLTENHQITDELMASSVADSSRYTVFDLMDKALLGDAPATAKCLTGLKEEGTQAPIVLWALTREIRSLIRLRQAQEQGENILRVAKTLGIFEKRLPLVRQALKRSKPNKLRALLRICALCDKSIKGQVRMSAWPILLEIALSLGGQSSLSSMSLKKALQL